MIYLIPELQFIDNESLSKSINESDYYTYFFQEDALEECASNLPPAETYNFNNNFQFFNYALALVAITKMFT